MNGKTGTTRTAPIRRAAAVLALLEAGPTSQTGCLSLLGSSGLGSAVSALPSYSHGRGMTHEK
jgi:hypothetical protein